MFLWARNKNYSPVRTFGGLWASRNKNINLEVEALQSMWCDLSSGLFGAVPGQPWVVCVYQVIHQGGGQVYKGKRDGSLKT